MREIRFRAWDKYLRKMTYRPDAQYSFEYCENGLIIGGFDNHEDYYELEVMQFTSLKDKYGKEIYEGDIVAWVSVGREGGNSEDIGLERDMGNSEVFFKDGKFLFHNTIPVGHINNELEIVGNIHEHPKLLEKT